AGGPFGEDVRPADPDAERGRRTGDRGEVEVVPEFLPVPGAVHRIGRGVDDAAEVVASDGDAERAGGAGDPFEIAAVFLVDAFERPVARIAGRVGRGEDVAFLVDSGAERGRGTGDADEARELEVDRGAPARRVAGRVGGGDDVAAAVDGGAE